MPRMKWSRLRSALKGRISPTLRDRVDFHQARYRHTREEVGRVWLTIEGTEIVSYDTSRYVARRAQISEEMRSGVGPFALGAESNYAEYLAADAAAVAHLRAAGEYDDYSALADLEAYLSLSIDDALASDSPLIRGLALLDGRLGKRRLRQMAPIADEHPLVRELFRLRCDAENIT